MVDPYCYVANKEACTLLFITCFPVKGEFIYEKWSLVYFVVSKSNLP